MQRATHKDIRKKEAQCLHFSFLTFPCIRKNCCEISFTLRLSEHFSCLNANTDWFRNAPLLSLIFLHLLCHYILDYYECLLSSEELCSLFPPFWRGGVCARNATETSHLLNCLWIALPSLPMLSLQLPSVFHQLTFCPQTLCPERIRKVITFRDKESAYISFGSNLKKKYNIFLQVWEAPEYREIST